MTSGRDEWRPGEDEAAYQTSERVLKREITTKVKIEAILEELHKCFRNGDYNLEFVNSQRGSGMALQVNIKRGTSMRTYDWLFTCTTSVKGTDLAQLFGVNLKSSVNKRNFSDNKIESAGSHLVITNMIEE